MKGLLWKDLYNMKLFVRSLLIVIAMLGVFGVLMKNPTYVCTVCIILSLSMSVSALSMDEKSNWDEYAMILPVSRKMIVLEKMILAITFLAIGITASIVLGGGILLWQGGEGLGFFLQICVMLAGVALILMSILMPVTLTLGAEKSRYIMMAIIMIPCILFVLIMQNMGDAGELWFETHLNEFLKAGSIGCVLAGLIAFGISYFISLAIYEKKEW